MRDRKLTKTDRTRDAKRAPSGAKSKSATVARRQARVNKRLHQGRA